MLSTENLIQNIVLLITLMLLDINTDIIQKVLK